MKASAHAYSEPLSSPRQERHRVSRRMAGRPRSIADVRFIRHLATLHELVWCEKYFGPVEHRVDHLCWLHAVVDDIAHRHAPDRLGSDLRHAGVEAMGKRHGQISKSFLV